MKKICRTIKLRKFKSYIDEETINKLRENEYIVCLEDDTYHWCLTKSELRYYLEKDHIKRVRYVFDTVDRIMVNRDVLINTDEA